MVRDQSAHWVWFDTSAVGVRRFQGPLDAVSLHRRLLDVLAQPDHYGDPVLAALDRGARADMAAVRAPVLVFDSEDRRDQWARMAAQLCPTVSVTPRPRATPELARCLLDFLDAR
jgi:hypothetical protein